MSTLIRRSLLTAATLFLASSAFGQIEIQLRPRQLPGWNHSAREGRCEIHVWIDNRAEVRMRGETVYVKTLEGSKSRDEGSNCSQPLPLNSVRDFQVKQIAGRSRLAVAQEPSRANNFTALINIEDRQGGGDTYVFEVTWRSEGDVATAPAPFFDEVRACQDLVRQRFLSANGRGSYIDFENFADRGQEQNRGRGRGQMDSIRGRGNARGRNESRDLTYSCVVDSRQHQVISGVYQYVGAGSQSYTRTRLK